MYGLVKSVLLSGVVLGGSLLAGGSQAQAQGWGVSIYSGAPGGYGGYGGYPSYGGGYNAYYGSSYRAYYGGPSMYYRSYNAYPSYYRGGGHHHHHHHCR